jgi:hypothetical protein
VPPGWITAPVIDPLALAVGINTLVPTVSFEVAPAASAVVQSVSSAAGSEAAPPNPAGQASKHLINGGVPADLIKTNGGNSDQPSDNGPAVADFTPFAPLSSGDLIRSFRDSEIAIKVSPPAAISDGNTQTWLFDEGAGAFVAQQPEPFAIVIDGDSADSVPPTDTPASDSLSGASSSWLYGLRDLKRALAAAWFDS